MPSSPVGGHYPAAEVLGRDDELGRIEAGYRADLVGVRADPLVDPSALRNPAFVLQAGRIIVRQ